MDLFVSVPAVTLGCYLVLLLIFVLSKHTMLNWSFMEIMASYVLWALGSMCMRFNFAPSVTFWFHLSLFGLILLPCALLHFTLRYIDEEFSFKFQLLAGGAIFLFFINLIGDGILIGPPEVIGTGETIQFVYHNTNAVLIPYLYLAMMLCCICGILIKAVRRGMLTKIEFLLLFSGKVILLLGNTLINVPMFSGFPIDMLSGVPDALLITLVLCFGDRFKQTMYVSRSLYRFLTMLAIGVLLLAMEGTYERFLMGYRYIPFIGNHIPEIIIFTFFVLNFIFFLLNETVTDKVFLKDREQRIKTLGRFNLESCQTLDVKKIRVLVQHAAVKLLEAEWAVLCIKDRTSGILCSEGTDENGNLWEFQKDNALIRYLRTHKERLDVTEAVHKNDMDEETFQQLTRLYAKKVGVIQPIVIENEVRALLLISDRKRKYQGEEMDCLDSLAAYSFTAIKNAELYETAYWEARTDELTEVGNRKYFYEYIHELQTGTLITLMLVKIDDFKIYNKMYGSAGGDELLRRVAKEIAGVLRNRIPVFRYGASEFALVFKGCDAQQAFKWAEKIRTAIMGISSGVEKNRMMVTASCGIYTTDKDEEPDMYLLDKCDMALYLAKKRGKNCSVVYQNGIEAANGSIVHIKKDIFSDYEPVFRALTAAIDAKDHYTFGHSQNVSYYAVELARAYGMNDENIEIIKEAGLLHDIGKIGIPEDILFKPGKLTEEEYHIMKGHVEQSIAMLHHLSGMEYVLPAILGYHERYDGKGYPRGIEGEHIPILARILCVVDSFDAMVSKRSYKPPYTQEHAIEQLEEGKGMQFDPELADIFITLLQEHKINVQGKSEIV